MSFPRYPKYRDSGVEWLGEVPQHWRVRRLKHACNVLPSNVDKKSHESETPVLLCNYTDVYYNEAIVAGMDFMEATASSDQIAKFTLRAGDTIITKDSETADDIAIAAHVPVDLPGVVCGYHLSVVRPLPDTNGAFVKRLFDSIYAKACFAVRANGLTRVGLSQYQLDNVELPFPSYAEQTQIAAFLDRETAKIDELIAEQQRLMDLLKEKRQAVISHAVTKGLNPDAPMKPSGIEWLGDIPEHWEVKKLGYLLSESPKNGVSPEITADGSTPTFSIAAVKNGTVDIQNHLKYASINLNDARQFFVRKSDILVLRGSGSKDLVGTVGIVNVDPPENCIYPDILIRIRPNDLILPSYIVACLNSSVLRPQIQVAAQTAAGIWKISGSSLQALRTPVPPLSEQSEIERHLQISAATSGALTVEAQRAINLLSERRTALISAAVTGQIDIRAVAERQAA